MGRWFSIFGGGVDPGVLLTLKTKHSGTITFSFTYDGIDVPVINMGDGTIINGNSVSHNYADGTEKTILISVLQASELYALSDLGGYSLTYADFSFFGVEPKLGNQPLLEVLKMPDNDVRVMSVYQSATLRYALINSLDLSKSWYGVSGGGLSLRSYLDMDSLTELILPDPSLRSTNEASFRWIQMTGHKISSVTPLDFSAFREATNQSRVSLVGDGTGSMPCPIFSHWSEFTSTRGMNYISMVNCGLYGTFSVKCFKDLTGLGGAFDCRDNPLVTDLEFEFDPAYEANYSTNVLINGTGVSLLDLTIFGRIGNVYFYNCPSLTDVVFKDSAPYTSYNNIHGYNCPLLTSLDLTPIGSNVSRNLYVYNNPLLTSIVFNVGTFIGLINLSATALTVIDLEVNDTIFSQGLNFINCNDLEDVFLAPSQTTVYYIYGYSSNVRRIGSSSTAIGKVDLGTRKLVRSNGLRVYNCPNITSFVVPEFSELSSGTLTIYGYSNSLIELDIVTQIQSLHLTTNVYLYFNNNALPAFQVDRFLVNIDTMTSAPISGTKRLNLHQGSNAAPTNGAITGFDGIAAKASLIVKGWTVTTN